MSEPESQATPAGPTIEDLTASPAFRDAVAAAVGAAMAGRQAEPATDWTDFMSNLKQLTQAFQVQSPGYNKPLPPDEIAKRDAGQAEFVRLLREASDAVEEFGRQGAVKRGLVPHYLIGPNGFYTDTDDGEQLFSPGQPMFLTKPPPMDFQPLNEPAGKIMHAQMQWLGRPSPSAEEMVAAAVTRANGGDPSMEDRRRDTRNSQFAEVVADSAPVPMGPRRIMGATVEESTDDGRGRFAITKGQVARPLTGPVFA